MGYRWKNKIDVDEAIVVVMNSLDQSKDLPGWLVHTIQQSIGDSDPEYVKYFYEQIGEHAPAAVEFFQGSCVGN